MLIIRMLIVGLIAVLFDGSPAFSQAMPTELRQENADTSSSNHIGQQGGLSRSSDKTVHKYYFAMPEHRAEHEFQDKMPEERPEQPMPKAMPEKLPEAMPKHVPENPAVKSVNCDCNCDNVTLQRKYDQLKRRYDSLLGLYNKMKIKCFSDK